ncbi:hypothetical protein KAJ41_01780, partial [Candidatus Parcubacteria bacterium]|nr:hypothetical protein [Candidatus Parcubacteria bacterium]
MKNKTKPMMMLMVVLVLIAMAYVFQGISMHNQVAIEEENFNQLQTTYWVQDKETRDAAETDSVLARDLVRLQQYPSQLLFLKLVGVGKILTGIFIVLFG